MYEAGCYVKLSCVKCSREYMYTGVTSCLCKHSIRKDGWVNEADKCTQTDKVELGTLNVWICSDCDKGSTNGQR